MITLELNSLLLANWVNNRHVKIIQPRALRAPEVILGADWGTPVDIWNLGCLVRLRALLQRHVSDMK